MHLLPSRAEYGGVLWQKHTGQLTFQGAIKIVMVSLCCVAMNPPSMHMSSHFVGNYVSIVIAFLGPYKMQKMWYKRPCCGRGSVLKPFKDARRCEHGSIALPATLVSIC